MTGGAPRTILVFRALDLGDMLCATPALRALRGAFRDARVTLCGSPWAEALVPHLAGLVDDFLPFPGDPRLAEACRPDHDRETFWAGVSTRHWDLALQLHGSGRVTNGILHRFPATAYGGLYPADTEPPEGCFVPWTQALHEIEQLLSVTEALGAPSTGTALEFHETGDDHAEFEHLSGRFGFRERDYCVVHPGAKWESRRWPADRFATVARHLAANGPVVLTGTAGERALAERVSTLASVPLINLAGRTSLGGFAAVLRRARLIVTNDTGASHLAVAVGTASITIASGSEVGRWAPLDPVRHPVLWRDAPCRPCTFEHCPFAHECADIPPASVVKQALRLLNARG